MILQLSNVQTFIGQFHILQDINLGVPEGEVTVFLGRNGAGKTTTLRTIMGLTPPTQGRITYRREILNGLSTYVIARKGIGLVPEDQGIFTKLTVDENLRLAIQSKDSTATKNRLPMVLDIFPDLKEKLKQKGGNLSGGQKQMLAIGRALLNDNRLLLVDEPSKGLAPIVVEKLAEAIREIKKHTTVVLVEQNFAFAQLLLWATVNDTIVVGSNYWNIGVAGTGGKIDADQDTEGIGIITHMADNMGYLLNQLKK